jgi:hypothetical protein
VDQDLGVLVGDLVLDVGLELAPRDEDGPGDRSLGVLVGFADVEDDDVAATRPQLVGLGGVEVVSVIPTQQVNNRTAELFPVTQSGRAAPS